MNIGPNSTFRKMKWQTRVLLADEPTGNLDSKTSVQIMGIFQELYEQGKTIIVVTHEPDIDAYAKSHIVVKDGRILKYEVESNGQG